MAKVGLGIVVLLVTVRELLKDSELVSEEVEEIML